MHYCHLDTDLDDLGPFDPVAYREKAERYAAAKAAFLASLFAAQPSPFRMLPGDCEMNVKADRPDGAW